MNPSKILGLIINIIFEYCFKNDYIYIILKNIYNWYILLFGKIYILNIAYIFKMKNKIIRTDDEN